MLFFLQFVVDPTTAHVTELSLEKYEVRDYLYIPEIPQKHVNYSSRYLTLHTSAIWNSATLTAYNFIGSRVKLKYNTYFL